ncbi:glycodelin [Phyllostomus discolor]|uniref:Glycodelin n=1 Tax=Phyllostomus discolor TaxID=89673 RepID=A0A7E6D9Y5_9CHIR|nr:glycodelin [Phyllostomus discolor]
MRCLLLALCVALARGAQDIFVPQIGENLDVQKVAGPWYPVAMVASDAALMNAESAPMRLNIKELRPTAQDGLEITVRRWEDGSCVERKMFAEKTEAPASFQIHSQEGDNMAPVPVQEGDNVGPVPVQEDDSVAPAAALGAGKVHVLDTDYQNYLFLCLEAAAATPSPAPAQRSLACQYLARTPEADQAAKEQFNRAVKLLSTHTSIAFTPAQAEGEHRPPPAAPSQRAVALGMSVSHGGL